MKKINWAQRVFWLLLFMILWDVFTFGWNVVIAGAKGRSHRRVYESEWYNENKDELSRLLIHLEADRIEREMFRIK